MTLYYVEETDPRLIDYYLFTDEGEPSMNDSYLCFLMEKKTLYLGEYDEQSRVFVNKKYVKKVVPMDEFPAEEMWGNTDDYGKFISTIKLILKNM